MLSEITEKRAVFFELVELLKKEHVLKEDIVSMGNLALFVDNAFPRYKWQEKRDKIEGFAKIGDRNEVNMLLASYLYEVARNLNISDNLNFKLEKMSLAHKEKKLTYFDIVLDPYDFPDWFKWVMEYYPSLSKQVVYERLVRWLERYPELLTNENQFAFSYFVDRLYPETNYLKRVTELDLHLRLMERHDLCWYISQHVFRFYYPQMQTNPSEQSFALQQLAKYKRQHEEQTLNQFDLFSNRGRSTLNIRL